MFLGERRTPPLDAFDQLMFEDFVVSKEFVSETGLREFMLWNGPLPGLKDAGFRMSTKIHKQILGHTRDEEPYWTDVWKHAFYCQFKGGVSTELAWISGHALVTRRGGFSVASFSYDPEGRRYRDTEIVEPIDESGAHRLAGLHLMVTDLNGDLPERIDVKSCVSLYKDWLVNKRFESMRLIVLEAAVD